MQVKEMRTYAERSDDYTDDLFFRCHLCNRDQLGYDVELPIGHARRSLLLLEKRTTHLLI